MSDFMVTKRIVLDVHVPQCPPGPAIRAIQQKNLERSQRRPKFEPVMAYQHQAPSDSRRQDK